MENDDDEYTIRATQDESGKWAVCVNWTNAVIGSCILAGVWFLVKAIVG